MTYVISFKNYVPSSRSDGIKWTGGIVQQAPDATDEPGTWSTIDTFVIADYPDPTVPPVINYSTHLATIAEGWFRLAFTDPGAGQEFTLPLWYSTSSARPNTRDVAAYIKNRTVDSNNNFVGDFTDNTAVTKDEVEELIIKGEDRILRRLDLDPNEPLPTESLPAIRDMISLYAAMLTELTKYSEQVAVGRSPYPHLKQLFDDQLPELVLDVLGPQAVDTGGGTGILVGDGKAQYTFDDDYGLGLIDWRTQL